MTASINDLFTQATNGTRPSPTTLTQLHTNGQTTLTVGALTGWPTATAVHFIVYQITTAGAKVAGSQTDWKGVVSGTTLINCVLKAGTDSGYPIGAIVECAPTAAWADDMVAGAVAQHNQDGSHAAVTATSVSATGVINASTVSSLQDTNVALSTYRNEAQFPFTASGGVWTGDAYASTRNASMTAWTGYINGQRGTISAVTARTFTASKDTYVDVLNTAGVFTLVYTEVTNNAASPALAANSMRIAIVVTGASAIAAAGSINQGQTGALLPIASSIAYSVTDSLGNLIYNLSPSPTLIGYKVDPNSYTPGGANQLITGCQVPVIVPAGRRIRITGNWNGGQSGSSSNAVTQALIKESSTQIGISGQGFVNGSTGSSNSSTPTVWAFTTPTSGLHTYTLTANILAGNVAVSPGSQIWVELA